MEQRQKHQQTGADKATARQSGRPSARGGMLFIAFVCLFCGLAGGAAAVYFALERPALEAAQARIQTYEQDLASMRGELTTAQNAAAALEGRFIVEESTRRGLETSLRTAQDELGRAHDTIAFYEQLMPPGPKGAISIRALDIERAGPNLRYRVLLMRSGSSDKPFQGRLQFVAKGRLNAEKAELPLLPATLPAPSAVGAGAGVEPADQPDEDAMAVEFSEFQRSSGLLALPEGFLPDSVTVNVLEGRTLRVSRSIELPSKE